MTDWRTRLRSRLAASGKTRAQVCSEAGLNPAYLTQILEQKGATPRIDNLGKLAVVLNTTVCYLVDGVEIDAEATETLSLYECLSPERKKLARLLLRDMAAMSAAEARGESSGGGDLPGGEIGVAPQAVDLLGSARA